jgi:hypothetical protein
MFFATIGTLLGSLLRADAFDAKLNRSLAIAVVGVVSVCFSAITISHLPFPISQLREFYEINPVPLGVAVIMLIVIVGSALLAAFVHAFRIRSVRVHTFAG